MLPLLVICFQVCLKAVFPQYVSHVLFWPRKKLAHGQVAFCFCFCLSDALETSLQSVCSFSLVHRSNYSNYIQHHLCLLRFYIFEQY